MSSTAKTAERRRAPRFTIRLPVIAAEGITLHTTNLSCTGTQLVCPALPRQLLRGELRDKSLSLLLQFPDHSQAAIRADVVYESDIGDESLLGIHFVEFAEGAKQTLYRFIEEKAGPGYLL